MNWKILPQKSQDLIEQLLLNRGIKTDGDKQRFFHPKLDYFEKDLKIPGTQKAVVRIKKAIKDSELIIAYGDYDVDGVAGAAVLYQGLTSAGARVLPYIPHREKEGYGLSPQGLEFTRDSGASLVITTDTGVVAFEMVDYAKKLGLDLIITDHHQTLDGKLPDALAIVHSTKICGAAVSWCFVRELISRKAADNLLDYVSIATISDMMPLLGVNRALVFEGLKKLNQTKRVGWLALFAEANLTPREITSYEIGHIIAPNLNAMGRLEHAIDSLRLLCTRDPVKAKKLAKLIIETNAQRKQMTQDALGEAKLMVKEKALIHVLASKTWVTGIIGLVAGRICDETGCSTVAISIGEDFSKGSARSGSGVNIVELLRKCGDLLEGVGGHPGAAGFTIKTENIDKLRKKLGDLVSSSRLPKADSNNTSTALSTGILRAEREVTLEIEVEVPVRVLNLGLVKKLDAFEPFGISNPRPILASYGMILSDLRTVGDGKHLKGKTDGLEFIAFGMGDLANILQNGQLVDLAYTLEIDKFNGLEKLQLKVKDLRIS